MFKSKFSGRGALRGGRISEVYASLTEEDKNKNQKESESLLALFVSLLKNMTDRTSREEILGELMALRAEYIIRHAIDGFKMDVDEALQLLKNTDDNNLTKGDIEKRDRLVAMVNNLTEFAVCEEYQMYKDVLAANPNIYDDEIDFNDEDAMEPYYEICNRYNSTYATVENEDAAYAMSIAAMWLWCSPNTYLTYMTQNDDRVRPWHYALQGFTARRDDFPAWMIPPIEWGCRCFLMSESGDIIASGDKVKQVQVGKPLDALAVKASFDVPEKPSQLDNIFSESVAKCGRIFGKSHPYFKVAKADKTKLKEYVENIRKQYYG